MPEVSEPRRTPTRRSTASYRRGTTSNGDTPRLGELVASAIRAARHWVEADQELRQLTDLYLQIRQGILRRRNSSLRLVNKSLCSTDGAQSQRAACKTTEGAYVGKAQ